MINSVLHPSVFDKVSHEDSGKLAAKYFLVGQTGYCFIAASGALWKQNYSKNVSFRTIGLGFTKNLLAIYVSQTTLCK